MPEIDETPHHRAIVRGVLAWHEKLSGTSGAGTNEAMRTVLRLARELSAIRLANELERVGNEGGDHEQ